MGPTATHETITEVWANGENVTVSQGRLDYVDGLITQRADSLDIAADRQGVPAATVKYVGEAFRVHVVGDIPTLLADDYCRGVLENVARHGERVGVVALVHGASLDEVTQAFGGVSSELTRGLMVGKAVQYIEPAGAPGLALPRHGDRAADALLSAARLVVGAEPEHVQAALDRALSGDSPSARAALAAALIAGAGLVEGRPVAEGAPASE